MLRKVASETKVTGTCKSSIRATTFARVYRDLRGAGPEKFTSTETFAPWTGAFVRLASVDLHHDERQIVVLVRGPNPRAKLLGDPRGDIRGRQVHHALQKLLEPCFAELLLARVQRLGDAVGERHEHVAGSKIDSGFLVRHLREQAEHGAADLQLVDLGLRGSR